MFAVTFDDGFENNYLHAWPVLRELNVPATIFVATKYLDTDAAVPVRRLVRGRIESRARIGMATAVDRQCDELLADGLIEIGAHTHSHEKFLGRVASFAATCGSASTCCASGSESSGRRLRFPTVTRAPNWSRRRSKWAWLAACRRARRRVMPGESEFEWGRIWTESYDTPAMLAAKMCWYPKLVNLGKPLGGGDGPGRTGNEPQGGRPPDRTGQRRIGWRV